MQAWEKCSAGEFNLSYSSLSSPAIRQELNKIAATSFYAEITSGKSQDAPSDLPEDGYVEDNPLVEDSRDDDVSLSTRQVKKRTLKKLRRKPPPEFSDSDDDYGVPGYEDLAMVGGEVQLVVPVRKSSRARTVTSRVTDPDWLDNDISTSEDDTQ